MRGFKEADVLRAQTLQSICRRDRICWVNKSSSPTRYHLKRLEWLADIGDFWRSWNDESNRDLLPKISVGDEIEKA